MDKGIASRTEAVMFEIPPDEEIKNNFPGLDSYPGK